MRPEATSHPRRISTRRSLGIVIPVAVGALVLIVGVALSTAAYLTVRRAALDDATGRLTTLSDQFSQTFRTTMGQLRNQVQTVADQKSVSDFLRSPTPALRPAALEAIVYKGPQREQVSVVEIRDDAGNVLLSTDAVMISDSFPRPGPFDSSVVGKFTQHRDSIFYPIAARVPGQPGGYLVQWRRVATAPEAPEQTSRFLGTEADLYFGNADGSVWTDLTNLAAAPPIELARVNGTQTYTRPGSRGQVLASVARVPGTPWMYTIELPVGTVMAPAAAFLRKMGLIAILCVTLGLAAAWLLSRQIVLPLRQLTDAADAIAAGDTRRRVQLSRPDEQGRLGDSFDAMASQVEESRQRLEDKVAARTKELNQTLERLQDAQESLVRREKLALVGHLASGVGHELRNPLGVMSNAVYYLEMVLGSAPDDVREYLGILRQQIALSGKIVNDLLDFSRINPAQRRTTSLKSIATEQLERLAPLDGIRVEQEFPESLPAVHVDPIHAGQVLMNLLTNAVQAMGDKGGTLKLRARLNGGDVVLLEVIDTGPGVAPENLERIFEPLFTTKARGIGLGLAVSKSLAQANGGDLAVTSEPGRGATFIFAMPAAPAQA
jgi:signal transduction histidine kinase